MKLGQVWNQERYQVEGLFFNLICGLYFIFVAPLLKDISTQNIYEENSYLPYLAILLLLISILEIYAFPLKLKFVHQSIKEHEHEAGSGFVLWMFHSVISIIITFSIFEAFGYELTSKDGNELPWFVSLSIFIVVIKELYLLFCIMDINDEETLQKYKRPHIKEWIADIILLIYACIAYTVTWETITSNMKLDGQDILLIMNYSICILLFLMFYLPLRIPYQIEEIANIKDDKDYFRYISSILFAVVSGIWHL